MLINKKNHWFLAAAILFFGLAIVGGVRGYSPVPFWDMWDGYLWFFTKVSDGDWSAWWAQHNEHRIVLARLFFWMDLAFFGGQAWFLVCVNYTLMLVVCWLFVFIWKEVEPDHQGKWVGYFLFAWLFWWIQKNNLEWGFQSQFILAQLLPLISFYLLHRACIAGPKNNGFFIFSIFVGVLSIGSMANGILALPIMVVYALMAKMGWRRVLLITGYAIFSVSLYFYGYKAPGGHGSLRQAILTNPIGLLHYVLIYMGGPFSFGSKSSGLWTATIAGLFLVTSSMVFAWGVLRKYRDDSLKLALLAFILYVGGTAFGTAGGRLIFGVEQALESRYMTPSLMAWAAFFIIFYVNSPRLKKWMNQKLWIPLSLLLVLMLPQQLVALKAQNIVLYERSMAALALEMGVKDQAQIQHVFPSAEAIINLVGIPVERNYSVFGSDPLIDLREKLGKLSKIENTLMKECKGHLDAVDQVDNDPKYLKIRGWVWHENKNGSNELIEIVDSDMRIVGYGLIGHDRPDVARQINKKARYAGFKAYLMANYQGQNLFIYNQSMGCRLKINSPVASRHSLEMIDTQIKSTASDLI